MAGHRFGEPDPVEEILRIAIQNQGGVEASLRQRLLASAADLGISEEAALAAEKQWLEQHQREADLAEYQADIRRDLVTHAGVFLVVNAILIAMNVLTSQYPWAVWPLLGWGIGLGCHAVASWVQLRNPGGEDLEKWRAHREFRTGSGLAVHTPRMPQSRGTTPDGRLRR